MNSTVPIPIEPDALDALLPASPAPARPAERHLRPVRPEARPARRRSPLAGALTAVGVVLAILTTQLGLSIAVSQGAYEARALESEQRDLSRVERVLAQNVDKLSSPQNLAENAAKLGMVQNAQPATLRLSDAAVLGGLGSDTSAVGENLVANSTLESMPVVDAEGLLVSRAAAAAPQEASTDAPVRWEGELPAPRTH